MGPWATHNTSCSWQNTNAQIRLATHGKCQVRPFFYTDATDQSTQTTALAAFVKESDTMILSSLARCVSQALCAVTPSECQDCASSKRRSSLDSIMTACKLMHIHAGTQARHKMQPPTPMRRRSPYRSLEGSSDKFSLVGTLFM